MNLATKSLEQLNRASIFGDILGVETSPYGEQDLYGKVPTLWRIYILNGHNQDSELRQPACLNESLVCNRQIAAVLLQKSLYRL